MDFPDGSDGKEFVCNVGDVGLIPGLRISPGGGQGNSLQARESPQLEEPEGLKSMGLYKSRTTLSD